MNLAKCCSSRKTYTRWLVFAWMWTTVLVTQEERWPSQRSPRDCPQIPMCVCATKQIHHTWIGNASTPSTLEAHHAMPLWESTLKPESIANLRPWTSEPRFGCVASIGACQGGHASWMIWTICVQSLDCVSCTCTHPHISQSLWFHPMSWPKPGNKQTGRKFLNGLLSNGNLRTTCGQGEPRRTMNEARRPKPELICLDDKACSMRLLLKTKSDCKINN